MVNPLHLRNTFNEAAEEYDAIRPGYPPALFTDVIELAQLPPGARLLEIGCGTGQATLPFARLGYRILCLDIGAELLAIAARKLKDYPNVHFKHTSFEHWSARLGRYDLVYSATAFHWVPPEVGYPKAALALKPGGSLAVFINEHPRPGTGFFAESQAVYQRVTPEWTDPANRPDTQTEIRAAAERIDATGLFAPVVVRTYPWTCVYTTAEYLRLLNTYSGHRTLEPAKRAALYDGLADLIETRYSGRLEKDYLSVLYLAKK